MLVSMVVSPSALQQTGEHSMLCSQMFVHAGGIFPLCFDQFWGSLLEKSKIK